MLSKSISTTTIETKEKPIEKQSQQPKEIKNKSIHERVTYSKSRLRPNTDDSRVSNKTKPQKIVSKNIADRLGKTIEERLGKTLTERLGKTMEERLGSKFYPDIECFECKSYGHYAVNDLDLNFTRTLNVLNVNLTDIMLLKTMEERLGSKFYPDIECFECKSYGHYAMKPPSALALMTVVSLVL
jgi:hypothetical protein